jgi:hypothetical protein
MLLIHLDQLYRTKFSFEPGPKEAIEVLVEANKRAKGNRLV